MPLFLTIFEGSTPADAQPLLATHDPAIIAQVRRLLLARLNGESTGTPVMFVPKGRKAARQKASDEARREPTERLKKRLYTIFEAAEYLGRSPWAIRSMVWSGKLPGVRDGKRILLDVHDLDCWINANKVQYVD